MLGNIKKEGLDTRVFENYLKVEITMKKALITGGNKGIGLEVTKMLLEKGYKIIVVARDFKDYPFRENENVQTISYDLNDVSGIADLMSEIGYVDVLINNAGIMYSLPYATYLAENKERLMNVNLYAPIEFIIQASKYMVQKQQGRIVNTASVAGQIGHPDIWYGVSKAGIINATKSFAKSLAPQGIVINAVAPGPVETQMMQVIPEDRKKSMKASVYTNRFAKADEVAKAITWLATESPEYINGVCLDINNGAFPR